MLTLQKILKPIVLSIGLIAMTGCEKTDFQPILREDKEVTTTVTIPETITQDSQGNPVIVPEHTSTKVVTVPTYAPNPKWTQTIQTVKAIDDTTAPFNPFAVPISVVLGGTSALLGYIAKVKNDKAKLVPVIIEAIEKLNDPKVKQAIQSTAIAAGVADQIHTEVKANT